MKKKRDKPCGLCHTLVARSRPPWAIIRFGVVPGVGNEPGAELRHRGIARTLLSLNAQTPWRSSRKYWPLQLISAIPRYRTERQGVRRYLASLRLPATISCDEHQCPGAHARSHIPGALFVGTPLDRAVCLPQILSRTIRISDDGKRSHGASVILFALDTADVLACRRPRPSFFKLSRLVIHQRMLGIR
jgi:hypothetical protein